MPAKIHSTSCSQPWKKCKILKPFQQEKLETDSSCLAPEQLLTSRERPKSAPYLRLKIVEGGPFDFKKFPKKNFFGNVIFEQCRSAEKCKRRDPLGFFDIHCVAKYRNK